MNAGTSVSEKRVLVVDDDPGILEAIGFLLEDEGYVFTLSERGDAAETLGEDTRDLPQVIILDVLLSGKDGRAICTRLKSREATRHIPIIMISAHPDAEQSTRAAGADAFMAKPFDMFALLALVEQYTHTPPRTAV